MRIYIAASAMNFPKARELAELLRSWGHTTTSEWHDQDESVIGYHNFGLQGDEIVGDMSDKALMDAGNVYSADALVVITGDRETRGGRHAECGMAIALGKRVYLLGPREQVFHWHPFVLPCNSPEAIKVALDLAPPFSQGTGSGSGTGNSG